MADEADYASLLVQHGDRGAEVQLGGIEIHPQLEALELLLRPDDRGVGPHERVGPHMPRMLPLGEAAGDEVAIAQDAEELPGAVVVDHRHYGDIPGLEHDRDFTGHGAGDSDVRIGHHHVSRSQRGLPSQGWGLAIWRSRGWGQERACASRTASAVTVARWPSAAYS